MSTWTAAENQLLLSILDQFPDEGYANIVSLMNEQTPPAGINIRTYNHNNMCWNHLNRVVRECAA